MDKYQVIKYLKEQGIGRKYINNCLNHYKRNSIAYYPLRFLVKNEISENLISGAFTGSHTPEGHDFGYRISINFTVWLQENRN